MLNELALFAGAGGGILGGKLLGWRTVCAVEIEDYPRRVLLQRQNDGILPTFPIWDDVTTFDGRPWRGLVDVVSGGFPCQDISCAGKGEGITGSRSGLWGEMARIIGEVRPEYVFVENSPLLVSRGLDRVLSDLTQKGFNAQWCLVSAEDCGAPHKRDRLWLVAESERHEIWHEPERLPGGRSNGIQGEGEAISRDNGKKELMANSQFKRLERHRADSRQPEISESGHDGCEDTDTDKGRFRGGEKITENWTVEPDVGRVVDGLPFRVDRLKALGNGQVPIVAKTAWKILTKGTTNANDKGLETAKKAR